MKFTATSLTRAQKRRLNLFYGYVNLPIILAAALGFLVPERSFVLFIAAGLAGIWLNHSAYAKTTAIAASPDIDQHAAKSFSRLSVAFRITSSLFVIAGVAIVVNWMLHHVNG